MKAAPVLDLQRAIDGQAFNQYHLRILLLCALSVLMDGFDAQAMGVVAPTLSAEWNISRVALGPILTAGLVGMLCGALFFGPMADRFGRRTILLFCTYLTLKEASELARRKTVSPVELGVCRYFRQVPGDKDHHSPTWVQ